MKYWTGGEYIGFGPNAASDFAGKYYTMVGDLQAYIDGIMNGGQVVADVLEIPVRERAGDYLMLRLRTTHGISAQEYERQYLLPFGTEEDCRAAVDKIMASLWDNGGVIAQLEFGLAAKAENVRAAMDQWRRYGV